MTVLAILVAFAAALNTLPTQDKKLKPEELVARHVESLGSKEAQSAARSRVAVGQMTLTMRVGGAGSLTGEGIIVSTGPKMRMNIKFPTVEYPGEDMAFDGSKAATSFLRSGNRSRLGAFVSQQEAVLKEGLLGGVLSTAWPLLRLDEQQPRIEYKGLKKIDGRELHEMSYRPRKGASELKILLHFDPATFRHVRTQYSFMIGATVGPREDPNINPESYYSLVEEFDDFREANGLMLPHKYRLQLSVQTGRTSALHDYNFSVSQISHNDKVEEKIFTLK
ncbi:MAG TPA: hypothetical protein VKA70_11155 [Blastocatellia bacterium]|nr:hypothetical protein [Blastocatellia bacterium]